MGMALHLCATSASLFIWPGPVDEDFSEHHSILGPYHEPCSAFLFSQVCPDIKAPGLPLDSILRPFLRLYSLVWYPGFKYLYADDS